MKNTIKELIVETLDGNNDSHGKLYKIYKKKINKFLLNKYYNNSDHVDDVSEILFKIFENLKKFDENKSNFDTWVHLIAKNYMIDKSRKNKPLYVAFTSNTFNCDETMLNSATSNYNGTVTNTSNFGSLNIIEPESYYQSPHKVLETNDTLEFISNNISVKDFSMLTMNSEGYSYCEIAKEFNSDESKISNKLNYTRKKMKKVKN